MYIIILQMLQFIKTFFGCSSISHKTHPDANHRYEQAMRLPFAWKYLPKTNYETNLQRYEEFLKHK